MILRIHFATVLVVLTTTCILELGVQGLERIRYRDILLQTRGDAEAPLRDENDDNASDVEELYLPHQTLDHFDPSNLSTFQQRYFSTSRYLVPESEHEVTFLCVGGEGPGFDKSVLVDSAHCSGDMLELAQRLSHHFRVSVNVYALEHRYYGKSYPTFENNENPTTTKNLKYLSSRQALEDLARFISTMKQVLPNGGGPWVTWGGSYPGFLSAQARMKYPALIFAAVSNSAPLQLEVDFPGYLDRVAWDLQYAKIGGSPECLEIVKHGHMQAVDLLMTSPGHHALLADMFHVCNPATALLDRNNQNLLLGDGLIEIYAQGNDPSCGQDDQDRLCNIERLCKAMTTVKKTSNVTDLQILADIAHRQSQDGLADDQDCRKVDWEATLKELSTPNNSPDAYRSWLWQTCTEVGFYQTCMENCPFASYYHLVDMDLEICRFAYNITNVYENVQSTLDHYGGLDINGGSRILSVNGNVDPWSVLGIGVSPKYSLPVEMVEGASHHFWTHAVKPTDAPEIVQIREYIYSVVMDWLDLSEMAEEASTLSLRGGGRVDE
jgi:serine protease 16